METIRKGTVYRNTAAFERIMIRDGERVKIGIGGKLYDFGRCTGAVRGGRVCMEINAPEPIRFQGLSQKPPLWFCTRYTGW